jgi:hypothetical protein
LRISAAPCAKSSASGSGKVRKAGATATSAQHREGGDAIAGLDVGAGRRAAHDSRDLAAGDERQWRSDLVEAARLQQLGERDAGRVDVDDDALLAAGEEVLRRRLRQLGELQRAARAAQLGDLKRLHDETSCSAGVVRGPGMLRN